jgi:hypothetical protein
MSVESEILESLQSHASAGMSATARAKLKATNDATARAKADNEKFAKSFNEDVPKDHWTLLQLLRRISQGENWADLHVLKLGRCLAMGWKPTSPADVCSFSRLVPDEEAMTPARLYEELSAHWPAKPAPELRLCASGAKCVMAKKRKPAPAAPRSKWCQCCKGRVN